MEISGITFDSCVTWLLVLTVSGWYQVKLAIKAKFRRDLCVFEMFCPPPTQVSKGGYKTSSTFTPLISSKTWCWFSHWFFFNLFEQRRQMQRTIHIFWPQGRKVIPNWEDYTSMERSKILVCPLRHCRRFWKGSVHVLFIHMIPFIPCGYLISLMNEFTFLESV